MHVFRLTMEIETDDGSRGYKGVVELDQWGDSLAAVGIEIGAGLTACGFVDKLAALAHAVENISTGHEEGEAREMLCVADRYLQQIEMKEGE